MDLQLQGKRALVTGSTAGIGFAAAAKLYREGASVVLNGRTTRWVEEAVRKIRGTDGTGQVSGIAADLSTAEGAAELVRQIPEVEILVNNVGISEPRPFEQIPDEDWLRFFEVNVMSGVRLMRDDLPGMKARNWGRVVFLSSESAVQIPSEMVHYGRPRPPTLPSPEGRPPCGLGSIVPASRRRWSSRTTKERLIQNSRAIWRKEPSFWSTASATRSRRSLE
jgi:NAD(P)-dependent dehydrogenase (short-subunit alcohol dehydrogenase family)